MSDKSASITLDLNREYPTNLVAIVVPIYNPEVSQQEQIALQHLLVNLPNHHKIAIAPHGLNLSKQFSDFELKIFPSDYFTSTSSYSKLLLSRSFYEAFQDYEYILIYQLDALVFSNTLTDWCSCDLDYIGAPWFKPNKGPSEGFSRVGNGGLSLRKVASFLRVLDPLRSAAISRPLWKQLLTIRLPDKDNYKGLDRLRKRLSIIRELRRGVSWYTANYGLNEDHFWSDRAVLFDSEFTVASVETGLQFAFEKFPRYCFEQNKYQLPFGCHAWAKWDPDFWEPYLLENRA